MIRQKKGTVGNNTEDLRIFDQANDHFARLFPEYAHLSSGAEDAKDAFRHAYGIGVITNLVGSSTAANYLGCLFEVGTWGQAGMLRFLDQLGISDNPVI